MAIATDCGSVWQEYRRGLQYQQSMGFAAAWPEYERFKMGDQWPASTPLTRNFPRPVINVVKYIVRNKKSAVLSQPVKMLFNAREAPADDEALAQSMEQGASLYSGFAQAVWDDVRQNELNARAVEDAATNGCGIFHYYWDGSEHGGLSPKYVGALKGEIIDAINIFFSDPQQRDVQKQAWVMISGREDTEALIALARRGGEPTQMILPDDDTAEEGYDAARAEPEGGKKTTVLTKYYRVPADPDNPLAGSEIFWTKVTKNAVIVPPTPLTPKGAPVKISLYPVEAFNWEERKKCAYGLGEIEGLLSFQKALNTGYGMMLLSVQQTAWPKLIVRQGALQQQPTNMPGEILTDYGAGGGDGIKYLQPPVFSSAPTAVLDNMLAMERTMTGTTEVMTGETLGANMAASAIIALQSQAKMPTRSIQERFYGSLARVGRIWEQFFKTYYSLPRSFAATDGATGRTRALTFVGTDYAGMSFGMDIDVGPATEFSESLQQSILDKLYDKGAITTEQYLKYAPKNLVPQGLLREVETAGQQKAAQAALLQEALQPSALQPSALQTALSQPEGLPQADDAGAPPRA